MNRRYPEHLLTNPVAKVQGPCVSHFLVKVASTLTSGFVELASSGCLVIVL